jgi:heptosyltransferase-3
VTLRNYLTTRPPKKLALAIADFGVSVFLLFAGRSDAQPLPKDVRKVLLVALGHLGDVLLYSYMLPSLRQRFPKAEIDVLTGTACRPVLEDNRYIDRILYFDHLRLNRKRISIFSKLAVHVSTFMTALIAIRKARYDVSIDPKTYYPNGNLLTYLGKIPLRIGFGSGGFGSLLNAELELPQDRPLRYEELMQSCLIACEVSSSAELVVYFPSASDATRAAFDLEDGQFCLILPESGAIRKMLAWTFWDNIVTMLLKNTSWKIVISGVEAATSDWAAGLILSERSP